MLQNRQNLRKMVRDCRRIHSLKLFFVVWFFLHGTVHVCGFSSLQQPPDLNFLRTFFEAKTKIVRSKTSP